MPRRQITADRMRHVNKARPNGIAVGSFRYVPDALALGQLGGNRFTVCSYGGGASGGTGDTLCGFADRAS